MTGHMEPPFSLHRHQAFTQCPYMCTWKVLSQWNKIIVKTWLIMLYCHVILAQRKTWFVCYLYQSSLSSPSSLCFRGSTVSTEWFVVQVAKLFRQSFIYFVNHYFEQVVGNSRHFSSAPLQVLTSLRLLWISLLQ